ncbi:hypothetical protein [Streptomyces sparsogenes]|nr:hypothetical protein [Streptomyces sparsogenes]
MHAELARLRGLEHGLREILHRVDASPVEATRSGGAVWRLTANLVMLQKAGRPPLWNRWSGDPPPPIDSLPPHQCLISGLDGCSDCGHPEDAVCHGGEATGW